MMIGGVSGGTGAYTPKPVSSGGSGDLAQLEQQKKAIQEDMKRIEGDDNLKPEAKKKQLDMLQQKLQRIEEAIGRASNEANKGDAGEPIAQDKPEHKPENKFDDSSVLNTYA